MNIPRQISSPRFLRSAKIGQLALINLPVLLLLGLLLSFIKPLWSSNGIPHSSASPAHAASAASGQINIPYFGSSNVAYTQTSIFWFGKVTGSDNYVDVRMGYNNSYLYVNLNIVDQYVWYDSHASHPDLSIGDTSTLYLDTAQSGSSTPQTTSYKFLAQVNNGQPRTNYQQAYQGNGTGWVVSSTAFTTVSGWRGTKINGGQDAGWSMTYMIPFSSIGKSGPPASGTSWEIAIQIHNETGSTGGTVNVTWWPATANNAAPSGWGNLIFGLPTYQPPSTTNNTTYTVQNGLNGQVVTDAMIGGGLNCFNTNAENNRWTQFGIQTYRQATRVNIENEQDVSDFNCFSKYYITFSLKSLPAGKGVVSAKVALYLNGNFGGNNGPNPSLIQVATANQAWNPTTIAWNNAPSVGEVISRATVNLCGACKKPGVLYTWDVSLAVANAYASGQPLQLVFYSMDSAYHTGKYFDSSYGYGSGIPALRVTLGNIS
jgi:hypothetical protein